MKALHFFTLISTTLFSLSFCKQKEDEATKNFDSVPGTATFINEIKGPRMPTGDVKGLYVSPDGQDIAVTFVAHNRDISNSTRYSFNHFAISTDGGNTWTLKDSKESSNAVGALAPTPEKGKYLTNLGAEGVAYLSNQGTSYATPASPNTPIPSFTLLATVQNTNAVLRVTSKISSVPDYRLFSGDLDNMPKIAPPRGANANIVVAGTNDGRLWSFASNGVFVTSTPEVDTNYTKKVDASLSGSGPIGIVTHAYTTEGYFTLQGNKPGKLYILDTTETDMTLVDAPNTSTFHLRWAGVVNGSLYALISDYDSEFSLYKSNLSGTSWQKVYSNASFNISAYSKYAKGKLYFSAGYRPVKNNSGDISNQLLLAFDFATETVIDVLDGQELNRPLFTTDLNLGKDGSLLAVAQRFAWQYNPSTKKWKNLQVACKTFGITKSEDLVVFSEDVKLFLGKTSTDLEQVAIVAPAGLAINETVYSMISSPLFDEVYLQLQNPNRNEPTRSSARFIPSSTSFEAMETDFITGYSGAGGRGGIVYRFDGNLIGINSYTETYRVSNDGGKTFQETSHPYYGRTAKGNLLRDIKVSATTESITIADAGNGNAKEVIINVLNPGDDDVAGDWEHQQISKYHFVTSGGKNHFLNLNTGRIYSSGDF